MKIQFDIKDFENDKPWLLNILGSLKRKKRFSRTKETDEFFCKTPALAYKYVDKVIAEFKCWDNKKCGPVYKNATKNRLPPELEKVFARSPKYGLKYLLITGQKSFRDKNFNERFMNKIFKCPLYSFVYARNILNSRISIEKEVVFLNDYQTMYQYSKQIIKGRFDKEMDKKITLLSFSEKEKERHDYKYLDLYMKHADDPENLTNVCNYHGRYF